MDTVDIDNLGIPPLAGICTYEDACKVGYDVTRNVALLKRYNYIASSLNRVFAAHVACTPEWEVKCAFSLHLWLVAEHAAALRARVAEMREPPLHLDTTPDERLHAWMDEVIRATSTVELLAGIYQVVLPAMATAMAKHLEDANPLFDYPTRRILTHIQRDIEDMIVWGQAALAALTREPEQQRAAEAWNAHLCWFRDAAGGVAGDHPQPVAGDHPQPITGDHPQPITGDRPRPVTGDRLRPRANGQPYVMDARPQRDQRFIDPYNRSALVDDYYRDEHRAADERVLALLYKRLREMDVPEWMGPIVYQTRGKPWEYYVDLSRQLWDEARHAMMGEVGLYAHGVPFYRYPIDIASSMALNTSYTPREAHVLLWGIEQSLMPRTTGKRYEWTIAQAAGDLLAAAFQDYDWADEVLHAQTGRKWLAPEFESMDEMRDAFAAILDRWTQEKDQLGERSTQHQWWPAFLADARRRRPVLAPLS